MRNHDRELEAELNRLTLSKRYNLTDVDDEGEDRKEEIEHSLTQAAFLISIAAFAMLAAIAASFLLG